MWDCRLRSDVLSRETHGEVRGSSVSSLSRHWMDSDQHSTHHHSVSDGVLSFSDSPPDNNVQRNRWTSPLPKFSSGAMGGSRSQTSWLPRSAERPFPARANNASSPSLGSASPLSESGQWESSTSTNKRPSRRSHVSKAVYPLTFRNPVSDCETEPDTITLGEATPSTLVELHGASPDTIDPLNTSSRREGFRWSSSASSYDGDQFEQLDLESLKSSSGPAVDQKCGVCRKLLWQKSPWSANRIVRGNGDMPTAGVLHCAHVFHAECLEQVTPKTRVHDPPCPSCSSKTAENESATEQPLQIALRSVRRSRGPLPYLEESGSSSLTSRLKRHFAIKGKSEKLVFRRNGSSST